MLGVLPVQLLPCCVHAGREVQLKHWELKPRSKWVEAETRFPTERSPDKDTPHIILKFKYTSRPASFLLSKNGRNTLRLRLFLS